MPAISAFGAAATEPASTPFELDLSVKSRCVTEVNSPVALVTTMLLEIAIFLAGSAVTLMAVVMLFVTLTLFDGVPFLWLEIRIQGNFPEIPSAWITVLLVMFVFNAPAMAIP